MKRKTLLFFFILSALASGELRLSAQENEFSTVSVEIDKDELTTTEDESSEEFVVRRSERKAARKYALSFQILDPIVKSLVSVHSFDFLGEQQTSRLIIPSFSFESQFELHRYVTFGIKGSIIPELISNPFYKGARGGYFYTDSEKTYPDASIPEEEWAHRVYSDQDEYFLNMHFLVDLSVRVLPFGEGIDTLKGFYVKAGGYFGFSIYQNVYLSYQESQSATVGGEISSASIPFFYPVEVSESGNGEELYEFVFGAVFGVGWQFVFPFGLYVDVGIDVTYDNTRKLIPQVPGLGWNANFALGYAW